MTQGEIRFATLDDIPDMVHIGKAYYDWSAESSLVEYDVPSVSKYVQQAILRPDQIALVATIDGKVVGGIIGVFGPMYINNKVVVLKETAFYVMPEHRGATGKALIKGFEDVAKTHNVSLVYLGAHVKANQKVMERYYNKQGYSKLDAVFVKEV